MPLPTIPTVCRCAIRLQRTGTVDEILNVIHVENSVPDPVATIDTFLEPAWRGMMAAHIPNTWAWIDVTYTQLNGAAAITIPWTDSQPSDSTANLPTNVAAVLGWRTALGGRSHRGRSFMGPLDLNAFDASIPDRLATSFVGALTTLGTTFVADMVASTFPLVVASYTHSTFEPVTSCVVNPKVCTQRRRSNGR